MAKNGNANRECQFCGQTWGRYEAPKCGCYRDIGTERTVKGCPERDGGNVFLMNCYVCPHFTNCEVRENAEVEHELATERPKPRQVKTVRRGAI